MSYLVLLALDVLPSHRAEIRQEMNVWCASHCTGGFTIDSPEQVRFGSRHDAEHFAHHFGGDLLALVA